MIQATGQPAWLNTTEYPFAPHFLELPVGRMHYVDEGTGEPILMLHGNPTWSFLYRHLIKGLRGEYRCIALDHIGFGLSDKPHDWTYVPKDHAQNVEQLINHLQLRDITLVVQDWGGPIGLSYAVNHPENIKRIIIMNTWMWPVVDDPHYKRFSAFMGGAVGRFLIKRFNFFVNVVMKQAMGDKSRLTKEIHNQYRFPLQNPNERKGCYTFPREIINSTEWLSSLWQKRAIIKNKPVLLLWGMRDIAFRKKELDTWKRLFPSPAVYTFDAVGHFVQEEKGAELIPLIQTFMQRRNGKE